VKIYGVFAPSVPEEDLRATTAKMSTTLRSSPWQRCDSYTTDGFAIGRISSSAIDQGVQPIWNEGRTRLIVGVGRIFEYDQMKRKLARAGHQFRYPGSDAEFVLHAFEEWGEDSLKELNGTFVFAMYDSRRRTLTIANDRYGMRPVYYYYGKGMFVFASEVKAIIEDGGVPREIDWSAWRDFFSYRYLLGTKTFFKGIFAIPNASLLSIDIDGIRQKRYWSYNQIQVDHEKSESYFVAKGARLIRQAIERQSVGLEECVVLLSGG
jgi:asparagine synthase (glutamine-hydrolysing)